MKLLVSLILILNSTLLWALPNNEGPQSISGLIICRGASSSNFNDCNKNSSSVGFCKCVDYRDKALFPGKTKRQRLSSLQPELEGSLEKLSKAHLLNDASEKVKHKKKQIENLHNLAGQIGFEDFKCLDKEKLLSNLGMTAEQAKIKSSKAPPWVALLAAEEDPNRAPLKPEEQGLTPSDKSFLLAQLTFVFEGNEIGRKAFEERKGLKTRNRNFAENLAQMENGDELFGNSLLYQVYKSNRGFSADSFSHALYAWGRQIAQDNPNQSVNFSTPEQLVEEISSSAEMQKRLGIFLDNACQRLNFLVDLDIEDFKRNNIESANLKIKSHLRALQDDDGSDWHSSIDYLQKLMRLKERDILEKGGDDRETKLMAFKNSVDRLYCQHYEDEKLTQDSLTPLSAEDQEKLRDWRLGIENTKDQILKLEEKKQNLRLECPMEDENQFIAKMMNRDETLNPPRAEAMYKRRYPPEKLAECENLKDIDSMITKLENRQRGQIEDLKTGIKNNLINFLKTNSSDKAARKLLASHGVDLKQFDTLSEEGKTQIYETIGNDVADNEVAKTTSRLSNVRLAASLDGFFKEDVSKTFDFISKESKSLDIDGRVLKNERSKLVKQRAEQLKFINNTYEANNLKQGKTENKSLLSGVEPTNEAKKWYDGLSSKKVESPQNAPTGMNSQLIQKAVNEKEAAKESESKKKKSSFDIQKMLASLIESRKESKSGKDKSDEKSVLNNKNKDEKKDKASNDLELAELKRKKMKIEIENLALERERLRLDSDVKELKSTPQKRSMTAEASPEAVSQISNPFGSDGGASKDSLSGSKDSATSGGGKSSSSPASAVLNSSSSDLGDFATANPYSTPSFTLSATDANSFDRELALIEVKENILKLLPSQREAYIQELFKDRNDQEILIKLPSGEIIKIQKGESNKKLAKKVPKVKKKIDSIPKRIPSGNRERYKLEGLEKALSPALQEK